MNEISEKQPVGNYQYKNMVESVLRAMESLGDHFEQLQYADAAAAWELTHKAQMAEAGLKVETVGEGIAILLQAFNERKASANG